MKLNSQNYSEILQQIKQQDIKLNAFLIEGQPYQFKDGIFKLQFLKNKEFHMNQIKKNKNKLIKILNSIVEDDVINIKVNIKIDITTEICELFDGEIIKANLEVLD